MEKSIDELMDNYFTIKEVPQRCKVLQTITFTCPPDSKDFFFRSFKKERYLDMKLTALRGYAHYATEEEVSVLTKKLLELLKKRPQSTPYNYEEYEIMRSAFLLPYLIKKYNYACLRELSDQVEKQYNDMPDVFKNIFSCDEYGNYYDIRDPEEVQKSHREFFDKKYGTKPSQ